MKIREDIVFDKSTGEATGFSYIDYDDWSTICDAERAMCKTKVGSQQSCHAHAYLDGLCCTEILVLSGSNNILKKREEPNIDHNVTLTSNEGFNIGSHLVGVTTLFNSLCIATIMNCDRHEMWNFITKDCLK